MAVSVASSTYIRDHAQADGSRWIRETHVLSNGKALVFDYLAPAAALDADIAALMTARAAGLLTDQANVEIARNIQTVAALGSMAAPSFVYSTTTANAAALREAYAGASQTEAVMMADYLNSLSNAQIQAAFGITSGQASTLRTNTLAPAAVTATAIRAAVGQ